MTKKDQAMAAEVERAEGIAYGLSEDGLAPIEAGPVAVDAGGFWDAVESINATVLAHARTLCSDPPDWLSRAIERADALRADADLEDGLIRGQDEPGEDDHRSAR